MRPRNLSRDALYVPRFQGVIERLSSSGIATHGSCQGDFGLDGERAYVVVDGCPEALDQVG